MNYRANAPPAVETRNQGITDAQNFYESPLKKNVTSKSTKKRSFKKQKSSDKSGRINGLKSLHRQTTFDGGQS